MDEAEGAEIVTFVVLGLLIYWARRLWKSGWFTRAEPAYKPPRVVYVDRYPSPPPKPPPSPKEEYAKAVQAIDGLPLETDEKEALKEQARERMVSRMRDELGW
jgi:hypothetical protein